MAKYEYYDTGDDGVYSCYSSGWRAQTFTPSIAHTIKSVKLKLHRSSTAYTLTVGIYATSSGLPTGSALCSGTLAGSSVTTDSAGAWYEITLGSGASLAAGTKYAIVISYSSGSINWVMNIHADTSSPTYSGGNVCYSSNSGDSWSAITAYDFQFEDWGDAVGGWSNIAKFNGIASADMAKFGGIAVADVAKLSGASV